MVDEALPVIKEEFKKIINEYSSTVTGQNVRFRPSPTIEETDNILYLTKKSDRLLRTGNFQNNFTEVIDSEGNKGWVYNEYLDCK